MNDQPALSDLIQNAASPLLAPRPLAHSQELADNLPQMRRHLGPRPWFQCLEQSPAARSPRS